MTVPEILWFFVELPFLLLHIATVIFVATMRSRRGPIYSSPFFLFFQIISIVDILYIIQNTLRMKLPVIPALHPFFSQHPLVPTVLYIIAAYLPHVGIFMRTVIAFNQYYVIRNAKATRGALTAWTSKKYSITAFAFVLPLPFVAFRFNIAQYKFDETDNTFSIVYNNPRVQTVVSITDALVHIVELLAILVLTAMAFAAYRSIRESGHVHSKDRNELRILVYSAFMSILLGLRIACEFVILFAHLFGNAKIYREAQFLFPFATSIYSLSGCTALFLTSVRTRSDFCHFYNINIAGIAPSPTMISKSSMAKETTQHQNGHSGRQASQTSKKFVF